MLNWFTDIAEDIGDFLSNIIGTVLWLLCDLFFIILDLFENLFKAFAGIGNASNASGEAIEGDLVLYLINSDVVQQIFMSILILSFFLLIIFSIVAIVKNQYADKQEPVSKIINSSFKALFMYLLVPVATVVCLLVGNIILQGIDGATKMTSTGGASDMLFITAAYNGNKFRYGDTDSHIRQLKIMLEDGDLPADIINAMNQTCNITIGEESTYRNADFAQMANILDEAFISGDLNGGFGETATKWSWNNVNNFYHPFGISYLLIWVGGAFLIWAIGKITWGMVARTFKMTLFYALSPAVMATFPLDNGKALGSWRGEMIKNGTMAYAAVGVMNVLYSVLPVLNEIHIGGAIGNGIVKLFIYIIAFSSAKDLIASISGWFGPGDALAEGVKAKAMVSKHVSPQKALGAFAGIRGGIKAAKDHGYSGDKFKDRMGRLAGGLMGGLESTGATKSLRDMQKTWTDSKKTGESGYKTWRTTNLSGDVDKVKLAKYEEYEQRDKLQKQYEAMGGGKDVYGASLDDGTDPEMLKRREFLYNASDAGQAIMEKELKEQEIKEKENKQEGEFIGILNELAKANKARVKAEAKLKAEYEATGHKNWDTLSEEQRQRVINHMIRTGKDAKGKDINTDLLQELNSAYNETVKTAKGAFKAVESQKTIDEEFKTFLEGAEGDAIFNDAKSVDLATLEKVEAEVIENKRKAKELEKNAEELKKQVAAHNQADIYGGITDSDHLKKIENYRKAHPKS